MTTPRTWPWGDTEPGKLTEEDVNKRISERDAAMQIADQVAEAERIKRVLSDHRQAAFGGAASLRSIDSVVDESWALPHMDDQPYGHGPMADRARLPACGGPCHQGRKPCPTPDACQTGDPPIEEITSADSEVLRVVLVIIACIAAAIVAWHVLGRVLA